jgi:hypothetical protein
MSQQTGPEKNVNGQAKVEKSSTEVVAKAKRRLFSVAYKKRVLAEVEKCTEAGQIGSILRREGLYSSHLNTWRGQQDRGEWESKSVSRRGRPAQPEMAQEMSQLRLENEHLHQRLSQLEAVIDIQKKVSQLIGLSYPTNQLDGNK